MRHKHIVGAFLVLSSMTAVAAEPVKTVFTVDPPMHCSSCENRIKSNLRFEKGVKRIDASAEAQEVVITYDPAKTDETKLIEAFAKIGYEATPEHEECAETAEEQTAE